MFDIECLVYPQFNHSNVVRNFYLSTISSELLAKVDVLKDMLVFRDHPNQFTGLFDTAEIAIDIKCICTVWLFVCLSVCYSCILILYFVYDFNNNNYTIFESDT